MITYFDTSALIPLLVEEPGSAIAEQLWDQADRAVSVRLVYAEARAALAQAERLGRLTRRQLPRLVDQLDDLRAAATALGVVTTSTSRARPWRRTAQPSPVRRSRSSVRPCA